MPALEARGCCQFVECQKCVDIGMSIIDSLLCPRLPLLNPPTKRGIDHCQRSAGIPWRSQEFGRRYDQRVVVNRSINTPGNVCDHRLQLSRANCYFAYSRKYFGSFRKLLWVEYPAHVRTVTSYENVAGRGVAARCSVHKPGPEMIPAHVRHAAHVSRLRSGHEAREQKRGKPRPTGPHRTNQTHRYRAQNDSRRAQQHGSELWSPIRDEEAAGSNPVGRPRTFLLVTPHRPRHPT